MADSLYNQSIPILIKYLKGTSGILKKAEEWCETNGKNEEEILSFRLIEDMRPLTYQMQSMSDTAKFLAVRVGGIEKITIEDNETTFQELQQRIDQTIEILGTVKAEVMNANTEKEIIMETARMGSFRFASGQTYVSEYAIPNFYFHMTTGYCILRHLGVPLTAMDYLKDVFHRV